MFGAATLIIAISARAALVPNLSIIQAALSVSSRACSIMMRASAMRSCVTVWPEMRVPNAMRLVVRRHIRSSALGQTDQPHAMMDAIRPEPTLGDLKHATFADQHVRYRDADIIEKHLRMAVGRFVISEDRQHAFHDDPRIGQWHQDHRLPPIAVRVVGVGLTHHDQDLAPRVERARGPRFAPLMTYSLPSRRMRVSILVASDEATSGSVIAKAERISPASNGSSQRRRCAGVP